MHKRKVQVYSNGEFIEEEINWIEQTEESIKEYMHQNYVFEEDEYESALLCRGGNPSEEEINGLHEIVRLEKGFEKYIVVYQWFESYDYLVCIDYGEDTYEELYACKDFKTLLAFLKELEPLINLIERDEALGDLEAIQEGIEEISNKIDNKEIASDKMALYHISKNFEYIDSSLKDWIKKTKRKNFVINDMCKEVIKAKKISQ